MSHATTFSRIIDISRFISLLAVRILSRDSAATTPAQGTLHTHKPPSSLLRISRVPTARLWTVTAAASLLQRPGKGGCLARAASRTHLWGGTPVAPVSTLSPLRVIAVVIVFCLFDQAVVAFPRNLVERLRDVFTRRRRSNPWGTHAQLPSTLPIEAAAV